MRFTVLGSGSRGNALAVQHDGATVLVDAGFGFKVLEERGRRAGVALDYVHAVVLTHEHGDHSRGAGALARRSGCPVFATAGTIRAMGRRLRKCEVVPLALGRSAEVAGLSVTVCRTSHDAAEPVAVSLSGPSAGQTLAVAYDVGWGTVALADFLRSANGVVLESNHDESLLRRGPYPRSVQARIAGRAGHLSNEEAAQLLGRICHDRLETVVLAHLSDTCNRAELALAAAKRSLDGVGFKGRLVVAKQGLPLGPLTLTNGKLQLELEGMA